MEHDRAALLVTIAVTIAAVLTACSSASPGEPRRSHGTDTSPAHPHDGDGTDGGAASPAASGPRAPPEPAEVNHLLVTGQSLSLGAMGSPPLSRSQPFGNMMLDTGLTASDREPKAFVPLVETATFLDVPVETPWSSMANLVTMLASVRSARHDLLVSAHGVSGASYPMIMKGTDAYARGLAQVRGAKAIAEAAGKPYHVRAIAVVHGESDGWNNWNDEYDRAMIAWQEAYDADIKAATAQTADIPMFHTQYSAWTPVEPRPTNVIPMAQLEAHKRGNGKVVLVGPKYQLPYAADGFHLTNEGYRWLGEYYAKAYVAQILDGRRWEPLRPSTITRAGTLVTIAFIVPVKPIVFDTTAVSDPGNFGFDVIDAGGAPVPITKIEISAPETVTLTLAREPAPAARVRYAAAGTPGQVGGAQSGPRGNLRDSDATPSRHGYALHDWCVHFDEPLP